MSLTLNPFWMMFPCIVHPHTDTEGIVGRACDLRPDNQTAGCHQGSADSSGSRCRSLFSLTARHSFCQSTAFFPTPLPMQQPFCRHCPEYQCIMFHCGGAVHCVCMQRLWLCVYLHTCIPICFCSWRIQAGELELDPARVPSSHNDRNHFLIGGWEHCEMMRWAAHKWDRWV